MRVVVDTNVFISGFRNSGKPRIVLEQAVAGAYTLILSEMIRLEIEAILSRKLGWSKPIADPRFEQLVGLAETVCPAHTVTDCDDPDDNMFLEAAVEGCADCVVSGDGHLLRMKTFRGIEILTVSDFLLRLESGASPRS
jgi:putative PIN family toxin of toxin-antitoxin system